MIAEAIFDIPAIPKMSDVDESVSRSGKIIMPNGGAAVMSRYLRARQGSCHDICKYGGRINLETDQSKSTRSPMPKLVIPKRGASHSPECIESNLGEIRRNKSEVSLKLSPYNRVQQPDDPFIIKIAQTQGGLHPEQNLKDSLEASAEIKPNYPLVSHNPSTHHLVDVKTVSAECEAPDEENAETKLSEGENKQYLKPSPESECQKPGVDPDCIATELPSTADEQTVSSKNVSLPFKESVVAAAAHARNSKLKPQLKSSSLLKESCSSGKENTDGSKSKKTNVKSTTSLAVSSCGNKGEITVSERMRTSVMGEKKHMVPLSVSLSPKETGTRVLKLNAKKKKSIGVSVSYSKKQENAKKIKPEKSCGKDAKGSKNLNRVSDLIDEENKKPNNEQASFADIPTKTLHVIESNSENNPAETIQGSVHVSSMSTIPSSSSEGKSIKHAQNRIPVGKSPRSYGKKNMIYMPKRIQVHGLRPSLSSSPGKKSLRSTPYGLNVTQPSLTFSSSLASSKSSCSHASSQHNEVAAKRQTSTSKMYTGRPKSALITTSKENNLLQSKQLNFQRAKVIKVPLEDCTPKRLVFKRRVLTDNRYNNNQKGKVDECSSGTLKFWQRLLVDNRKDDNQKDNVEGSPTRRLKFRQRVFVDNRKDDNQNGKVEECFPRRLKFRKRVLADNTKDDTQSGRGGEITLRRLKFRKRVLADNTKDDTQSGRGGEITLRRLKFKQRVPIGNINADSPHGRCEDHTSMKLKFKRRTINENRSGNIQNIEGDTSKENSEGKEADLGRHNATEVQFNKISLKHNDIAEKKDSESLYNDVIEEAASRLGRTNSSKVKALVSVFESVICHFDSSVSVTSETQ